MILVRGDHGEDHAERFLVDTGADRTVLSAFARKAASLAEENLPPGFGLAGVGGQPDITAVSTVLEFIRCVDSPVIIRGQFASFLDVAAATDFSILGRDVLKNFDVIISQPRDQVLLLTGNHRYRVEQA